MLRAPRTPRLIADTKAKIERVNPSNRGTQTNARQHLKSAACAKDETPSTISRSQNNVAIATSERINIMSDFRSLNIRLPFIRRRSFLATIASIAATLTVTRRSYGAEVLTSNAGSGNVRLPGETAMRPSRGRAPATIDLKTLGPEHQVV